MKQADVCVWSWDTLVRKLNFRGCDVLIVDTEGYDVKILRSMIEHCKKETGDVWPYVIQFETQGHADTFNGKNSEWEIIDELERHGYTLVHYSHYNSQLALKSKINKSTPIQEWAKTLVCSGCTKQNRYPYLSCSDDWKIYCRQCGLANPRKGWHGASATSFRGEPPSWAPLSK